MKKRCSIVKGRVAARPPKNRPSWVEENEGLVSPRLARVLDQLTQTKQQANGQYLALCPAHDDSTPSLSITENDNGAILLNCYSGCSRDDILNAIGLSVADITGNRVKKVPNAPFATTIGSDNSVPSTAISNGSREPITIGLGKGDSPGAREPWSEMQARFCKALSHGHLRSICCSLNVSEEALQKLQVGYDKEQIGWTFPERDGQGRICGILLRDYRGEKKSFPGSRRGISIPGTITLNPGDRLYLVEGPSDVAALVDLGLNAIGRPSSTGGAVQLAECLQGLPADTEIFVVGENDQRDDGTWPGREGAESTAEQLAEMLSRPIKWALVPKGAKDSRHWLERRQKPGNTSLKNLGRKFERILRKNACAVSPESWNRFSLQETHLFLERDFKNEWLVKDVLISGQIAVLGGPKKSLKTSIAVDLAVSLASGTSFLQTFRVARPHRVGVFSGESGGATLQRIVRRILNRIPDASLAELPLYWELDLPRLSSPGDLSALSFAIRRHSLEVVIIDPLYLCLLAGNVSLDASNLYQMGPLLAAVTKTCLDAGATPILVHHTRKLATKSFGKSTSSKSDPIELDDLAFSGVPEIVRQWILLNPRIKYAHQGKHDLWMTIGGSAGHSGRYRITVDEGIMDEDFAGRIWDVHVQTIAELANEEERHRVEAKAKDATDAGERILEALKQPHYRKGATLNELLEGAKIGRNRAKLLLQKFVDQSIVVKCQKMVRAGPGQRRRDAFRLKKRD